MNNPILLLAIAFVIFTGLIWLVKMWLAEDEPDEDLSGDGDAGPAGYRKEPGDDLITDALSDMTVVETIEFLEEWMYE